MAAVKRDYYEVLGLPKEADDDAIRGAFHALAREWHPDVANSPEAEERFRELAEAYSVLSKREARLLYDRYGYRGRGNQGFEEEIWDGQAPVARGENIHTELRLKSFEADEGTRRLVAFDAIVRCTACMGRGAAGLPDPDCERCLGTGKSRNVLQTYFADVPELGNACPDCVGEPCSRCEGTGTVVTTRRIRLRIPPGVADGTLLRVTGDGNDAGAGSVPGDLLVRLQVDPAPRDPRVVRYVAFVLLLAAVATLVLYVLH